MLHAHATKKYFIFSDRGAERSFCSQAAAFKEKQTRACGLTLCVELNLCSDNLLPFKFKSVFFQINPHIGL